MILSNCLCSLTVQSSSPEFSDFFFSSRRRHTRCTLGTGVQTCALPISTSARVACRRQNEHIKRQHRSRGVALHKIGKAACQWIACGPPGDRKSVVSGKSVSVSVDLGGRRIIKKHITHKYNIYITANRSKRRRLTHPSETPITNKN